MATTSGIRAWLENRLLKIDVAVLTRALEALARTFPPPARRRGGRGIARARSA